MKTTRGGTGATASSAHTARICTHIATVMLHRSQLSLKEILEAWERDRLGLFELVRGEVEGLLGEGCKAAGPFLDPSSMTAVVEYLVELSSGGECSVKVVYADDPGRARTRLAARLWRSRRLRELRD